MKEIFDIHRFGALWVKFHREHLKTNLLFIAVMAVITFLCLCQFNPFVPEYRQVVSEVQKADFLNYYRDMYRALFWGLFFFFSMFVAVRSLKDFMSPHRALGALLLPASSFEKYLLAFLNSTILILAVYLVVFYGVAEVVNSYKYAGVNELVFSEGWLGIKMPVVPEGQAALRPVTGNVLYLVQGKFAAHPPLVPLFWSLAVIGWIFFVALFMWGSITFRKRAILSTILIHLLAFIVWGYGLYWMMAGMIEKFLINQEQTGSPIEVLPREDSAYLPLLFCLFPLSYLWVVWLKLKNKQLN